MKKFLRASILSGGLLALLIAPAHAQNVTAQPNDGASKASNIFSGSIFAPILNKASGNNPPAQQPTNTNANINTNANVSANVPSGVTPAMQSQFGPDYLKTPERPPGSVTTQNYGPSAVPGVTPEMQSQFGSDYLQMPQRPTPPVSAHAAALMQNISNTLQMSQQRQLELQQAQQQSAQIVNGQSLQVSAQRQKELADAQAQSSKIISNYNQQQPQQTSAMGAAQIIQSASQLKISEDRQKELAAAQAQAAQIIGMPINQIHSNAMMGARPAATETPTPDVNPADYQNIIDDPNSSEGF